MFNGRSIFGIGSNSVNVGCVVLDDSHTCIDLIKESQTLRIIKGESDGLYESIISLFADSLSAQGAGSFFDIQNEDSDTFLQVPYWSWLDAKDEVLRYLSENAKSSSSELFFVWPLIKDKISEYTCFVSGKEIEISPYCATVQMYGAFASAGQRILLSATTQDDSFFVKGLDFNISAIRNPLVSKVNIWSGEKMIIIPSLISEACDRNIVVSHFAAAEYKEYGVVSIVPNTYKTSQYQSLGAEITNSENVTSVINNLKNRTMNRLVVLNNRYDGIDLPDETCRILIIDSMPSFKKLSDRYEVQCRPNSEIINKKLSQKIEQGIGRSVRGEKDYCAIVIVGADLVKFIRSKSTRLYFSNQTQKQIDIGLKIAELAKEDIDETKHTLHPVFSMIKQILGRDPDWKDYYVQTMNTINVDSTDSQMYERLLDEYRIEMLYSHGEYRKAADDMQKYIDKLMVDEKEKAWYLQQKARYLYSVDRKESIHLQKSAWIANPYLLKPQCEIEYQKLSFIQCLRMQNIKKELSRYEDYNELNLSINDLLERLSFGVEADKFEDALNQIGVLLGFVCERPDYSYRQGPDNLWCGTNNKYCFFECKSQVVSTRNVISKKEVGQMDSHCGWFDEKYGTNVEVGRYMIIPTKEVSHDANFTHKVRIIRSHNLTKLKNNIKKLINEMQKYDLSDISDELLQTWINRKRQTVRLS